MLESGILNLGLLAVLLIVMSAYTFSHVRFASKDHLAGGEQPWWLSNWRTVLTSLLVVGALVLPVSEDSRGLWQIVGAWFIGA